MSANEDGYIRLETPPPSPPSYIRLPGGTPTSSQSRSLPLSVVTPTRKQRIGSSRNPRKAPKKRVQLQIDPSTLQDGPDWDMAAPELVTGSEPMWNSQGRGADTALNDFNDYNMRNGESDDCGYSEYCEAIQEEGGAFYQIGAELFVVNGWDPRTRTSKVSLIYFRANSFGLISISLLGTTCRDPPSAKDLLPSAGAHWPGRMSPASTNDFLPNMERNYFRWRNSHTVSGISPSLCSVSKNRRRR
jgi:hypothetical protein